MCLPGAVPRRDVLAGGHRVRVVVGAVIQELRMMTATIARE